MWKTTMNISAIYRWDKIPFSFVFLGFVTITFIIFPVAFTILKEMKLIYITYTMRTSLRIERSVLFFLFFFFWGKNQMTKRGCTQNNLVKQSSASAISHPTTECWRCRRQKLMKHKTYYLFFSSNILLRFQNHSRFSGIQFFYEENNHYMYVSN